MIKPKPIGLLSITALVLLSSTGLSDAKRYKHPTIHEARALLKLPEALVDTDANGNAITVKREPEPILIQTISYLQPVPVVPVEIKPTPAAKAAYDSGTVISILGGAFAAMLLSWLIWFIPKHRRLKHEYQPATDVETRDNRSNGFIGELHQSYAKFRGHAIEQNSSQGNEQPAVYPWKERDVEGRTGGRGNDTVLGRYGLGHPPDSALSVWSRNLCP